MQVVSQRNRQARVLAVYRFLLEMAKDNDWLKKIYFTDESWFEVEQNTGYGGGFHPDRETAAAHRFVSKVKWPFIIIT